VLQNTEVMPKVSAVMSCYNEELTVRQAIDSIVDQTYTDWEFIILDDGSQDSTIEIIKEYTKKDSRIRLFQNEVNLGLAASLNKGIKNAQGEYIARMDADDVSLPLRLEKQVNYLDTHKEIDILGTNAQLKRGHQEEGQTQVPLRHTDIYKNRYRKTILVHPTVMMRKSCFTNDGYDPDLRWAEDKDLWLRWMDQFTFANLSEPLLVYKVKDRITWKIFVMNHRVLWQNMARKGEVFSHFHEFLKSVFGHLRRMTQ